MLGYALHIFVFGHHPRWFDELTIRGDVQKYQNKIHPKCLLAILSFLESSLINEFTLEKSYITHFEYKKLPKPYSIDFIINMRHPHKYLNYRLHSYIMLKFLLPSYLHFCVRT